MITTKSPAETHAAAKEFTEKLIQKTDVGAIIVGLYGDLGSGKTSFVQGVALALGIADSVASPTFVLQKIYKLDESVQKRFSHLIHIDAYRMESLRELDHIGWEEIIKDSRNLICIEWPEKVAQRMPKQHIKIEFQFVDESTRTISIST